MVIANTQVQPPLKPIIREAQGFTCESAVVLAHGVVLLLHKGRIYALADLRSLQILLEGLLHAEDQLLGNLHHLSLAALLDHLSIYQFGTCFQAWLAGPSWFACVQEYPPAAEVLEGRASSHWGLWSLKKTCKEQSLTALVFLIS